MESGLRVCRKCLVRGMSEEDYFRKLDVYIANLDEDIRVDQKLYEQRLGICQDCEKLMNGMCRLCGCFVELRAALKARHCPDLVKKW